jgi:hypothetical protein
LIFSSFTHPVIFSALLPAHDLTVVVPWNVLHTLHSLLHIYLLVFLPSFIPLPHLFSPFART